MSDLIDRIVESAGQMISKVDEGGKIQSTLSGLRHQVAEADRKRNISRVKQQIQELESKEAHAITALSAQVLAMYDAGTLTQPELVALCRGIDEIRADIKAKEAELAKLEPPPPAPAPAAPSAPAVAPAAGAPAPAAPAPGEEVRCPSCGVAVVAGAAFCQTCGKPLAKQGPSAPVLFCVHCGAQLREGARFCPKCGLDLPQP
ncbi:MAG: zinc-ribbon domain-containing protein [Anaerolineae bacterium]|nr:zinc-ribbon domain-containing protein [Anaerolineae bacterium]